ncbi:phosphate signaling complex PhoU family protein [Fusobacterium sp. MFO224]|uniref:phosphate signaling complex PhoU family protein n=1 Tax=Fusobacterium sp. MFO224 TaxID=3378070 RepID=UPI0038531BB3
MRNLEESLKALNEHYLEMLKNLNRMLDVNIEMLEEGKNLSSLYGECLVVEDIINAFEVNLKENSIIAIARFQPAAKNLRELVMLIDGGRLVERMGDILKKNIKILKEINEESPELALVLNKRLLPYIVKIKNVYEVYINSFINGNESLLYELIVADEKINEEANKIMHEMEKCMKENTDNIHNLARAIVLTKKYERFADHIIHLVTDLVYILKGENLRKKELLEKEN